MPVIYDDASNNSVYFDGLVPVESPALRIIRKHKQNVKVIGTPLVNTQL